LTWILHSSQFQELGTSPCSLQFHLWVWIWPFLVLKFYFLKLYTCSLCPATHFLSPHTLLWCFKCISPFDAFTRISTQSISNSLHSCCASPPECLSPCPTSTSSCSDSVIFIGLPADRDSISPTLLPSIVFHFNCENSELPYLVSI
jgi:hypothetical protein